MDHFRPRVIGGRQEHRIRTRACSTDGALVLVAMRRIKCALSPQLAAARADRRSKVAPMTRVAMFVVCAQEVALHLKG